MVGIECFSVVESFTTHPLFIKNFIITFSHSHQYLGTHSRNLGRSLMKPLQFSPSRPRPVHLHGKFPKSASLVAAEFYSHLWSALSRKI